MKSTVATIARALDALWLVAMGLFLGLTGGMVLSVILTFRGAREIDASPGVEPFNDPRFAAYANDAVAGYIGQDLFMVGGVVALGLLGLAVLSRLLHGLLLKVGKRQRTTGSPGLSTVRGALLCLCLGLILLAGQVMVQINADWPGLYDLGADQPTRKVRRAMFERAHQNSERLVGTAWVCGLLALAITPWCQRVADAPKEATQ